MTQDWKISACFQNFMELDMKKKKKMDPKAETYGFQDPKTGLG